MADRERLLNVSRGEDFSFNGQEMLAKVVEAYDGDTVRIVFDWKGDLVQWPARMTRYDSPEMKPSKQNPNRTAEKAAAVAARDALLEKTNGIIRIRCGRFDKYGRILVDVFTEGGEDVNAWMISQGHGRLYDGGKKNPFDGDHP